MNILKKTVLAVVMTGMTMVGSASAQDWLGGEPKKPIDELKVGFSFRGGAGGNQYVIQYVEKLREMADELGIELVTVDAEDDPGRQTQQMPELIVQQPDVIVVWALNAAGIVPAIRQAHDAGIPVVTVVADVDESGRIWSRRMLARTIPCKAPRLPKRWSPPWAAKEMSLRCEVRPVSRRPISATRHSSMLQPNIPTSSCSTRRTATGRSARGNR